MMMVGYQARQRPLSDAAGVHHHTAASPERAGRDVLAPLRADDAGIAMRPADLAPDDAEPGVLHLLLRPIHVREPLTEVPLRILPCMHALNLDQGAGGIDVRLAALEAEDDPFGVQAHWLPRLLLRRLLFGTTGRDLLLLCGHVCKQRLD